LRTWSPQSSFLKDARWPDFYRVAQCAAVTSLTLMPYFTKDLKKARKPINARSEMVATCEIFRAAFAKRRCLVPAAAYYDGATIPMGSGPIDKAGQAKFP
jgi:hypothetical protein